MSATVTPSDDEGTLLGSNPDVDRVMDNVLLTLPAATEPLIKVALWNTIEEFAIRSTYFRQRVSWVMGISVPTVDFNPYDAEMTVVWVLEVTGLTHYRVQPPARLIDLQRPMTARDGTALLVLKPVSFECLCGCSLPELWSTWFETILDGTLFRLYGMPAKPWSSPQLSQYHGTRFRQGLNRARDIANRLHTDQQYYWRYPLFARGRRKN